MCHCNVDEEFDRVRFDVVRDFNLEEVCGMLDEQSHSVLAVQWTMESKISLMDSGDKRSMERWCRCTVLRASLTLWQSLSSLRQEMLSLVRMKAGLAREECS